MLKVYVISLGCPKNLVDTEEMLGRYKDHIEISSCLDSSDVVLINTCGFIQPAVEEAISTILEVVEKIKECKKRPYLVVTGCLVQRYGVSTLKKELPEVDFWIPINEQTRWLEIVKKNLKFSKAFHRIISTPISYAYLKISEGCNHKCSFCLIPSIRGKYRSREIKEIKRDLDVIAKRETKEIVVVAQDVTFYGKDKGIKDGLKIVLEEILKTRTHWLRLLYLNPLGITKDLLKFLKEISPPFVPYFDVPIQHTHPDILKKMGRSPSSPYVIEKIKEVFPDACIRTSIIVGFPGEEKRHFEHMFRFVENMQFNHLGVFKYYHEEGTKSYYSFDDDVDEDTKEKRRRELLELQREISRNLLQKYKGKELDVLIDRQSEDWPTIFVGRAWFQAPEIDGVTYVSCLNKRPIGKIIKTKIDQTYDYDLSGLEIPSSL